MGNGSGSYLLEKEIIRKQRSNDRALTDKPMLRNIKKLPGDNRMEKLYPRNWFKSFALGTGLAFTPALIDSLMAAPVSEAERP